MEVMSYTSARNNFKDAMNRVCDDHTPIVITRQNERPVVMMSLEDYNAMEETAYLLRSPANAQRLMRSLKEAEEGNHKERDLLE